MKARLRRAVTVPERLQVGEALVVDAATGEVRAVRLTRLTPEDVAHLVAAGAAVLEAGTVARAPHSAKATARERATGHGWTVHTGGGA